MLQDGDKVQVYVKPHNPFVCYAKVCAHARTAQLVDEGGSLLGAVTVLPEHSVCPRCQREFVVTRPSKKFCSAACMAVMRQRRYRLRRR